MKVTPSTPTAPAEPEQATKPVTPLLHDDGTPGWLASVDQAQGKVLMVPVPAPADSAGRAPELWLIPAGGAPRSLGLVSIHRAHTVAVPEALRKAYFSAKEGGFQIIERLRNLVTFRELNLHHPWPMKGRFDVIFCRNVVIYFDPQAEEMLWQRFEAALAPRGWIHVGHSERIPLERGRRLTTAGITTYRLPDEAATKGESACIKRPTARHGCR